MKLFPQKGAGTALAKLAPAPLPLTAKVQSPATIQTKGLPVMSYPVQLFFDIAQSGVNAATAKTAMAAYALCYACLRYRATKLTEPPIWIADESDEGEAWLKGEHELSTILEEPNPDMEMAEFLDLVSLYLDTTGACLITLDKDNAGRTARMYPFSRDEFAVEPANDRLFGRFQVRTRTGNEWRTPEEVIYLRHPNPRNIYEVLSPTDAALAHINLGRDMVTSIRSALRNAIRPGAVITVEGELSDEGFQRLRQEVKANYEGVYNSGSTVLLEGGAKLTEAKGATLVDMALGYLQEDVESGICEAFQIHPVLVSAKLGVQASSGMSDSIKPLTDKFYDDVVIPRWQYLEKKLTAGLLRPIDVTPRRVLKFDTSDIRALQVDMTARIEEAAGAAGFWTRNEQRVHTLRPPVKTPDGNQIASDIVSAADQAAQQQAASRAGQARQNAGQKDWWFEGFDALGNAVSFEYSGDHAELMARLHETKVATVFLGQRHIAPELVTKAWNAFDSKAAGQEPLYKTMAVAQLESESQHVIQLLESSVPNAKALDPIAFAAALLGPYLEAASLKIAAAYAVGGIFFQQWVKRYRPLVSSTMASAGKDLVDQIGVDFTLTNPEVQRAIARRVTKLAGNVTETTSQQIRDVITQAKADGVGVAEIAKRIRSQVFGDTISKKRATTIARTETVGALNEAEMVAAQSSGVFRAKKWISQRVGDSRENHIEEENAGWVPIDAPYTVTSKMYPHDGIGGAAEDINCRCSQLFSDLTADEANGGAQ